MTRPFIKTDTHTHKKKAHSLRHIQMRIELCTYTHTYIRRHKWSLTDVCVWCRITHMHYFIRVDSCVQWSELIYCVSMHRVHNLLSLCSTLQYFFLLLSILVTSFGGSVFIFLNPRINFQLKYSSFFLYALRHFETEILKLFCTISLRRSLVDFLDLSCLPYILRVTRSPSSVSLLCVPKIQRLRLYFASIFH